ncbi:MAG: hypothetical protein ACE5JP_18605 [Candidatus Bipolaricaulia bacterium]
MDEQQGYYTLTLDTEQKDDQVVEHDGETVLLVDEDTQAQLEGFVLDFHNAPGGSRLTFLPKEQGQEQHRRFTKLKSGLN